MQPTFREATGGDVEQVLPMVEEFHALDGHPFDRSVVRKALEELVGNPELGRVWLIQDGAATVGYIVLGFGYSLEFHGRDAFIDELFLVESYRGRGWGRMALEFAEREAASLGVRALHLEVTRANHRAREVYTSYGFRDHERTLMTKWIDR